MPSSSNRDEVEYLRYKDLEQEKEIVRLKSQVRRLRERKPVSWWKTFLLGVPILLIVVFTLETDLRLEEFYVTKSGLIIMAVIFLASLGVYVYARRK